MKLMSKSGNVEVWQVWEDYGHGPVDEYYVYEGDRLVRVCPSLGMANEVAAGCR